VHLYISCIPTNPKRRQNQTSGLPHGCQHIGADKVTTSADDVRHAAQAQTQRALVWRLYGVTVSLLRLLLEWRVEDPDGEDIVNKKETIAHYQQNPHSPSEVPLVHGQAANK